MHMAGGWTKWSLEALSNPKYSVICEKEPSSFSCTAIQSASKDENNISIELKISCFHLLSWQR